MNFFCRLFGHTWWPETRTSHLRWNTTKEGHTLDVTSSEHEVRHIELCKRCGEEREVGARRHDGDRPFAGNADEPKEGAA